MRLTVYFPEDSPTSHECVGDKLTIGRLGDNDVALDEASVSSRHAEIVALDGAAVLRDLESTNGTFLNGEQITGEHPLQQGDEIYFGGVRSVFMEAPLAPAAEAEESVVEPAGAFAVAEAGTGRPEGFRYMSPFPRPQPPKDRSALVAWSCAGLGVLAGAYALFAIFTA